MATVKLDLDDKTDQEVIDFGKTIVTSMTGNANFVSPEPKLNDLTTELNATQTKLNDVDLKKAQWQAAVSAKDAAIVLVKQMITSEGAYIQNISNGNETIIKSAGVQVKSDGSPRALPEKITDVKLTQGDDDGEVDIMWHSLKRMVNTYSIRYTYGNIDTPDWNNAPQSPTKSKYTLTGLTSGNKIWIEVAGNNAAGKGGWSDTAVIYVP